jgi:hypothetical protein
LALFIVNGIFQGTIGRSAFGSNGLGGRDVPIGGAASDFELRGAELDGVRLDLYTQDPSRPSVETPRSSWGQIILPSGEGEPGG